MKKKILLIALMVALFVCLFVVSASATNNIIELKECPTLEEIRANRAEYVSHLDAFDSNSYYQKDSASVVVLCDQQASPTYYVFPASYIFQSTEYSLNFSTLNTEIAKVNSSLFANYTETAGSRGGTIYMIRIELPTYITYFGYDKFEGNKNVKEIYFPTKIVIDEETGEEKEVTYFSAFNQGDFFNGASALEVIHNIDKVPTKAYTNAMFAGCSSLKEIVIPEGYTSIPGSCFSGCSSLTEIKLPSTITSIGLKGFYKCSSLTEIILPNGVKSVGKLAFSGCTMLETLSLGANFTTLTRENADYETTTYCSSLKYVYLPEGFLTAISGASANDYKHIFNITSTKITFFFTGTEEQASQIKTLMATTNNNPNLGNAEIEKYDPSVDYTNYAATKGSNVIVWGYNICKAFYNNEHIMSDATELSVDSYVSEFDELCECKVCHDKTKVNEAPYSPIFKFLGFSAELNGDQICAGYSFDKESLEAYERITGKSISFGVVAIVPPANADMSAFEPVNANLTPYDEYTILTSITRNYASFDFVIRGFTSAHYDIALTMCAFVADGTDVDYIISEEGNDVQNEYASTITFNGVL